MSGLIRRVLRIFAYVRDLEQRAFYDTLTGLLQRGRFFELFKDRLAKTDAIALVYIDLNGFKSINDRYGHAVGDKVLKIFACHANAFFGEKKGIVGRMGGDEFAVVLSDNREQGLSDMCARFVEFLAARPIAHKNRHIFIDFSCGIATTTRDGRDPDALFAAADERMFKQKRRIRHDVRRR
ncbi:MAG: GGDEF domain-containing protein [Patescibacteria group bacterium]